MAPSLRCGRALAFAFFLWLLVPSDPLSSAPHPSRPVPFPSLHSPLDPTWLRLPPPAFRAHGFSTTPRRIWATLRAHATAPRWAKCAWAQSTDPTAASVTPGSRRAWPRRATLCAGGLGSHGSLGLLGTHGTHGTLGNSATHSPARLARRRPFCWTDCGGLCVAMLLLARPSGAWAPRARRCLRAHIMWRRIRARSTAIDAALPDVAAPACGVQGCSTRFCTRSSL